MQITVRNHFLLRLFGFEPASDNAVMSMHHSHWLHAAWSRITGRVRGWKKPYIHGQQR